MSRNDNNQNAEGFFSQNEPNTGSSESVLINQNDYSVNEEVPFFNRIILMLKYVLLFIKFNV